MFSIENVIGHRLTVSQSLCFCLKLSQHHNDMCCYHFPIYFWPRNMLTNLYNSFRRITTNQQYFPEIDGIRFLAIVLVILFHTHGYFLGKSTITFADSPGSYSLLNTFLINGDRGVELFFVLSGFVLCLPFAQYYINNGKKVQLKKYYLRRLTRLEPPYIIAMTLFFAMQLIMHVHPLGILFPSWLASLIYAHNFIFHHAPLLTVVAWSLEIEIQFYVLAPILFSILSLKPVARRSILIGLTLLIIMLQHSFPLPQNVLNIYAFAQYFFIGTLLADFHVSNTAPAFFNKSWIPFGAAVCLVAICFLPIKDSSLPPSLILLYRLTLPFIIALFYFMVLKNEKVKQMNEMKE